MEKSTYELSREVVNLRERVVQQQENALKQAKKITRSYFLISVVSVLILFAMVMFWNHYPIYYKTIYIVIMVICIAVAIGTATMFSMWCEKEKKHQGNVNIEKFHLKTAKEELQELCKKM